MERRRTYREILLPWKTACDTCVNKMWDEIASLYRVSKRNGEYKDVSQLINMFYCAGTGTVRFGCCDYIKMRCGCRSLLSWIKRGIFRVENRFSGDRQFFMFVSQSRFIGFIVIRTTELSWMHFTFKPSSFVVVWYLFRYSPWFDQRFNAERDWRFLIN